MGAAPEELERVPEAPTAGTTLGAELCHALATTARDGLPARRRAHRGYRRPSIRVPLRLRPRRAGGRRSIQSHALAVSGRVRIRRLPGEEWTGPAAVRRSSRAARNGCGVPRSAALRTPARARAPPRGRGGHRAHSRTARARRGIESTPRYRRGRSRRSRFPTTRRARTLTTPRDVTRGRLRAAERAQTLMRGVRSEEHTSELQS